MARPQIKLYVDTVSPFAYEAYWILRVIYLFYFFGVSLIRDTTVELQELFFITDTQSFLLYSAILSLRTAMSPLCLSSWAG